MLKIQKKKEKKALIFQKKESKILPIQFGGKKIVMKPKIDDDDDKSIKKGFFKRKNLNKSKKINWKLAFREFPVKMAKEITRIRWMNKGNLGRKFLITILFIIAFALFYLVLDLILHHLLTVIRII